MTVEMDPPLSDIEPVLVVDDEPSVCDVLTRAVEVSGHPWQASLSGAGALSALREQAFALVLSDIRMPDVSGVQILRSIVSDSPHTAVILVTGQPDVEGAVAAMRLGACDYVVKPFDVDDLIQRIESALERRRHLLDAERQRARLERELDHRSGQARRVLIGAVKSLATALDARDGYTHGHSRRVTALAAALAERMGLEAAAIERINLAGMLHDIGKIGIREAVLNKAEPLSDEEYAHIQTHPVIAQAILEPVLGSADPAPVDRDGLGTAAPVQLIRWHHERYDGMGYPDGLAGERIPLEARILAVADAFDAMTSVRPYREPMSRERALEVLREGRGRQWDPAAVDALVHLPAETLQRCIEDAAGGEFGALASACPDPVSAATR